MNIASDNQPQPCPDCLDMGHYIASCATGPHPEGTWTNGKFVAIDDLDETPATVIRKHKKDNGKKFLFW